MTTTGLPTVRAPRWRELAVWIGPALLVVGFFVEKFWTSFPAPRALELTVLIALVVGLAEIARRATRWCLATSLAMIFGVALIVFAGPLAALAGVLLASAAACIGAAIERGRADAFSALIGISVITGLVGWLLPFPVHWRWAYLAVLIAPIIVWRAVLVETARHAAQGWRAAVDASPRAAVLAVLAVGICSTGCWLPTLQYDDLAYHLGLPSQLSALHYYRLDAHSQIWALAPWSGDIVQAIAQLLAGGEARGAVDALWLLTIAALMWRLCRLLDASVTTCWLAVAVAASQPLLVSLCAGMQSELPATAAALALAVAVLDKNVESPNADAMRFACLAALLLGLKTGFVAIVLPLALVYAWERRARGFSIRTVWASAACLVLCGSSYFYATLLTGDPFFPLFAHAFHASYPAPDMNDLRWHGDIGATALWQLTFHTAAYHEGWNGAAGISMLGLCGASFVALSVPRTRTVALCGLLSFAVAIATVHYLRYAFPAAVLLIAPSMTALAQTLSLRRATTLACALVAVNLGYQSCASWVLHVAGLKRRVFETDVHLFERFAPTRNLVRAVDGVSTVLFCSADDPANAELAGRGLTVAHYDMELERARIAADADPAGAAWRTPFQQTQARYAVVSLKGSDNPALRAALSDAKLVREENARQLWELTTAPTSDEFVRSRDAARTLWP